MPARHLSPCDNQFEPRQNQFCGDAVQRFSEWSHRLCDLHHRNSERQSGKDGQDVEDQELLATVHKRDAGGVEPVIALSDFLHLPAIIPAFRQIEHPAENGPERREEQFYDSRRAAVEQFRIGQIQQGSVRFRVVAEQNEAGLRVARLQVPDQ
ncbi:hypothetical protein SDC9_174097 [bioreactor metagenome]|uniref:Uncharacterized protein n=1 Tax=bioreactor metagenome TaxID=1076179 RepID=A0A645GLC6_9ZZZZ